LNLAHDATVDDVLNAVNALNQKVIDLEAEKTTIQNSLTEKTDALTAEVEAHAVTKQAFEDFKNEDAGKETEPIKTKDEFPVDDPKVANYTHNKVADKFIKK
jgi:hypothetical protein